LLRVDPNGLWCEAGGFHIDPWCPVPKAVITHGHSDHARPGSDAYLCAEPCRPVLKARLGEETLVQTLPYGSSLQIGDVAVSFHPAGHVLGSAQVRLESRGEVWVVSGDYKLAPDETCTPFEPVRCNTFITESTFGLPIFRWRAAEQVLGSINEWWRTNQQRGKCSVIFAYSLGKAQRVLAGLDLGRPAARFRLVTRNRDRAAFSARLTLDEEIRVRFDRRSFGLDADQGKTPPPLY
jgi:putative mRNA 3-end processing factor